MAKTIVSSPVGNPQEVVLGELRYRAQTPARPIVLSFAIVALFLSVGLALLGHAACELHFSGGLFSLSNEKGISLSAAVFQIGTGEALLIYAGFRLRDVIQLRRSALEIFEHGFRRISSDGVETVVWTSLAFVREVIRFDGFSSAGQGEADLPPRVQDRVFELTTQSGQKFEFGKDEISRSIVCEELLRDAARRTALPWDVVEVHNCLG